jgi:integrase
MASLRKRGDRHYVRYTDADGVRHETEGFTDKRVAEHRARELETEVEKIRAGLIDPNELTLRDHGVKPVADHLDDYHRHLIAKGGTHKHADLAKHRARRVIEVAKVDRLPAMTASRVQGALKAILDQPVPKRKGKGAHKTAKPSLATLNHYRTAIRAFSRWLWKDGRIGTDALSGVTGFNAKEDRRHDRRTLGVNEIRTVIENTQSGPTWGKMTGPARALCYRLAVGTGLRYSEIASIRPESLDWKASPATVTVSAAYTKNGDPATLPIPSDLAGDLASYVATIAPGKSIFPLSPDAGARMLRPDLERAGIAYRDAGGLVFDFHALRCQCATLLDAAGVTPRVVQRVMRHSTLELTGRYTRPRAVDLNRASESLPSLRPNADRPESSTLYATGTDGHHISECCGPILPTIGDGIGGIVRDADVMAGSDERSSIIQNPRKTEGFEGVRGAVMASEVSTGVGTRTPDLRIMRPPL